MVRTKADSVPAAYRKAVAAAAPRKSFGASSANQSSSSGQAATPAKGKYAGGNLVCPRPTPDWQKGIGDFFGGPPRKPEEEKNLKPEKENLKPEKENLKPVEVDDGEEAGGSGVSKASRKSRPLPADDEEEED
ncbi:PCNA-associated factor [Dissostichus eleginoides]|uniref:PCNA-associated factor n=1 Tax=Dissostichus eleginoides TaxID=100907 RepID=A0AAD9BSK6_DISEL|nr:PCNA-associated factor [Dissostichus eleginoides]